MQIRIGYELGFEVPQPTSMQLMLYVHPDQAGALRHRETIVVEPATAVEDFIDAFGNRVARILAPAGSVRIRYDNVIDDPGTPDAPITGLRLIPVHEMPPECWQFLLASRYCEVDRMSAIAWELFGSTPESWERVRAVVDWVHANVTFGYQFARPTKSAWDVYQERQGVCRDFQHLAITFLRATRRVSWATSACRPRRVRWTSQPGPRSTWTARGMRSTPGTIRRASAAW